MLRALVISIFLLTSHFAFGQIYADGAALDTTKGAHYLLVTPNYKKKQILFDLEYAAIRKNVKLTDAQGAPLAFDSLVGGFEFLYRQGWELCTAIAEASGINGVVSIASSYLFQRRK